MKKSENNFIQVYRGSFQQASDVQFLLESRGVHCFIQDEDLKGDTSGQACAEKNTSVNVMVMKEKSDEAIAVIASRGIDI